MDLEERRQLIHILFGAILIAFTVFLGLRLALAGLLLFNIALLMVIHARMEEWGVRWIKKVFFKFGRVDEFVGKGSLLYAASALFILSFASKPPGSLDFALGVIAILAFGDGFATLIGRNGRHGLPWCKKKTWEGLTAFILFGAFSSFPVLGLSAIVYSIILGFVESLDVLDDNVLIPLAAFAMKLIGL